MKRFDIVANEYLSRNIKGYYHDDYEGGGKWKVEGTLENIITTIKNDELNKSEEELHDALDEMERILRSDLNNFSREMTICIVPRAKMESYYHPNQLLFKKLIQYLITDMCFKDGSNYIMRRINTRTTHRKKKNDGGEFPYPGITKDTCKISDEVAGKVILLIDDIYTKSVNVDEDIIQALLDKGAKSIIFYAVGKTVYRSTYYDGI